MTKVARFLIYCTKTISTQKKVFWVKDFESWDTRILATTPHGNIKVASVFYLHLLLVHHFRSKLPKFPQSLLIWEKQIRPVFSVLDIVMKNHSDFGVPSHGQWRKVSKPKWSGSRWTNEYSSPLENVERATSTISPSLRDEHIWFDVTCPTHRLLKNTPYSVGQRGP